MIDFITEKETERLIQQEVRALALPDGASEPVRTSVLIWEIFDLILQTNIYSYDELIDLTRGNMDGSGYSFSEAFCSVISYIHQKHDW
jgi:hypothetical protein